MADTDTPDTDVKPPAARRRAPRKTTASKPVAAKSSATRAPAAKAPAKVAPAKPVAAEKPAAATPRKTPAKPAPKPRSTTRSTPRPSSTRQTAAKSPVSRATDKVGGKWGAAAIAGGVAVIGAAAALLTLRGSTPKAPTPKNGDGPKNEDAAKLKGKHAHQADGTDSTKSFDAGIADPGTVPE